MVGRWIVSSVSSCTNRKPPSASSEEIWLASFENDRPAFSHFPLFFRVNNIFSHFQTFSPNIFSGLFPRQTWMKINHADRWKWLVRVYKWTRRRTSPLHVRWNGWSRAAQEERFWGIFRALRATPRATRSSLGLPLSEWKGQTASERVSLDDVDRVHWDADCAEWAEETWKQC